MITVITGHYGSGKTTAAAHIAAELAGKGSTCIVDMDTVNPYYRTADLKDFFAAHGVTLIAPMYARTNLDLPVLDFDIPAVAARFNNTIIDMGGDDAGAYPLGKFAGYLSARSEEKELSHLFTVNFCRMLTETPELALESMRETEAACRLPVTGIINNTNLRDETDENVIAGGIEKAQALSVLSGLPVVFTAVPAFVGGFEGSGYRKFDILIKNKWEE